MKKLLYFIAFVFAIGSLSSCKKDNPLLDEPPTLDDIVAIYSGETLKLTVDGHTTSGNAIITVIQEKDSTMTLGLENIVPGTPKLYIPKSTFEVVTRAYGSKVSGIKEDTLAGYKVTITGQVFNRILTATVTLEEINGTLTNVRNFYNKTYKGDMVVNIPNQSNPFVFMQRIYTSRPMAGDTSSIKLQINNFSFSGIELGDIVFDTIKVLKRGDVYGFKAKNRTLKLNGIGDVKVNMYGTMVGGDMTITMSMNVGLMPVNIAFSGQQVTETTDTKISITMPGNDILEQPVESNSRYTFKIWSSLPASKMVLIPTVVVPIGAVIDSVLLYNDDTKVYTKIDLNTAIDFSKFSEKSCVQYYVMPEDIRKGSVKSLYIAKMGINPVYTMEEWVVVNNEKPTPKGLKNSNILVEIMSSYIDLNGKFPVMKATDGAAEIRTFRTVSPSAPNTVIPGVTAGILFNGIYSTDLSSILKSSNFGELIEKEPVKLKFTYKYAPGPEFHKTLSGDSIWNGELVTYHNTEVVPGMKDSCSINAYLYEVSNDKESLDGTNINTSKKVIMKAVYSNGATNTNYEEIEIPFISTSNGIYDPKKLYKLAIVCSSSIRGDQFMGAPGSLLTVKRLEVVVR